MTTNERMFYIAITAVAFASATAFMFWVYILVDQLKGRL